MSHLQHPTAITFSPQDIQQQQEKVASQSQQVQQMQQDFQLLGGTCWKVGSSRMEVVMITIILWLLIMLLYFIICTEPPIQRWRIPGVSRGDTRQVSQTWRSEQGTWKLCSWQGKIAVAGHAQWLSATIVTQFITVHKLLQIRLHTRSNNFAIQCVSMCFQMTYQDLPRKIIQFKFDLDWIPGAMNDIPAIFDLPLRPSWWHKISTPCCKWCRRCGWKAVKMLSQCEGKRGTIPETFASLLRET